MACLFIFHEMIKISKAKELCDEIKQIKAHNKLYHYSSMILSLCCIEIIYLIWALIGLTTSQMPIFLVFLLISAIPKKKVLMYKIDGYISILLLIFILINKYQLHINFTKMLIR